MPGREMLVLAIDTSHKNGSVCLARGDDTSFESVASSVVDGGMFSAQLVPAISRLLQQAGSSKKDLNGMAAAVGPGSFTGLRIGLSAVKGLADVLKLPIAAVSVLEAIAAAAPKSANYPKTILAAMDAGRSEYYAGEYQLRAGALHKINEFLCTRSEFTKEISSRKASVFIVTTEADVEALAKSEDVSCEVVAQPTCEMVARLGIRKLLANQTVSVEELDANYVRRDDGLFAAKK